MELFKLLGTIAINNDQANEAIADTTAKADDGSKKTVSAFGRIGTAAVKIGKGVMTAGAVLGGAWIAAIEGSREYRTEMGKLDTAFVTNGHSSQTAKQTYQDLQAVLGDTAQAVEAANHLAMMTDNEKDLATWTEICTGVYATFGDSLPIESLTESSNEVAKSGELTGGLVDALVWAGIGEEEFQEKLDACTNEQERQNLIMDTLNGTYSKASEQYKQTNKDVLAANEAQERLTNAFSRLGEVGEPIMTLIKDKVAEFVTAAIPHLESFIQWIKDMKTWIADNEQTIKNWGAAIAGASTSIGILLLVLNWGKIMTAAKTAIMGVRTAVLLFNAALRANPIGLVVSLIAGLVAAFVILWNENEEFRNFWLDMWEKIKTGSANAVDWIEDKLDSLGEMASKVGKWFGDIYESISDNINDAWEAVEKAVGKITGLFPLDIGKIFDNIKIPKITVSGGEAPYGIAGYGKLPSFNVKWNAKGAVFDQPTIFSTPQGFQGVGDAGPEAVAPIATLQAYIRDAVKEQDESLIRTMIEQNRLMMDFLQRAIPHAVRLDSGTLVGELVPAIDGRLNDRYSHAMRGNTR